MLIVMADESGFQTDGYFGIAGYFADHRVWRVFDERWRDALVRHKAPYLHMKEFSGSRGVYKGWSEDQRRGLMHDCLQALVSVELGAMGTVLKVADFKSLPEDQQEQYVGPYVCCFHEMMYGTGLQRVDAFPGDRIDFVYSRQDEFKKHMRRIWRYSKRNRPYGKSLGVLDFQDMRHVPGLQAADLLAYEFRHYYHLKEKRPDIKDLRFPFEVMISHQSYYNRKLLKYLPLWYLMCQGAGIIEPVMQVLFDDVDLYRDMHMELQPPGMDVFGRLARMRVLEKYVTYPGDTYRFRSLLTVDPWERARHRRVFGGSIL